MMAPRAHSTRDGHDARPGTASLAALAMAALIVVIAMDRPAEAIGPRTMVGLREALRLLPEPVTRAARDLVGSARYDALTLARTPASAWVPASSDAEVAEAGLAPRAPSPPRAGLIDLPPPAC